MQKLEYINKKKLEFTWYVFKVKNACGVGIYSP